MDQSLVTLVSQMSDTYYTKLYHYINIIIITNQTNKVTHDLIFLLKTPRGYTRTSTYTVCKLDYCV